VLPNISQARPTENVLTFYSLSFFSPLSQPAPIKNVLTIAVDESANISATGFASVAVVKRRGMILCRVFQDRINSVQANTFQKPYTSA
jgi:hypothetical protein